MTLTVKALLYVQPNCSIWRALSSGLLDDALLDLFFPLECLNISSVL